MLSFIANLAIVVTPTALYLCVTGSCGQFLQVNMAEWVEELQRYNNWTLTPLEFKKRYRIGKGPVKEVCDDFWASGFCGNKSPHAGVRRLGYDERVSYNTIITMHYVL